MIGRCSAFGLAVTAALLLAFPISATAATRGDLNIHVDGTFATATANGIADVTLGGLVGVDARGDRLLAAAGTAGLARFDVTVQPFPIDGTDTTVGCVLNAVRGTGVCIVVGKVFGLGTARIVTLEPRPGGRLVFDVDFPNAVCPSCVTRS